MIVNIHRIDQDNLGDMASSPCQYFDLGRVERADCMNWPWPQADCYIVGGGGLLGQGWEGDLKALTESAKTIFWGVGSNIHETTEPAWPEFIKGSPLAGVRDHGNPFDYVPCPSCMHPAFGIFRHIAPQRDYLIYEHHGARLSISGPARICNRQPISFFGDVIALMAQSRCIISNSYHGLYWAMLLGRKAVCVSPMSSRFYGFKYPPQFATAEDWKEKAEAAQVYPDYLEECRAENVKFYSKAKELISK
jgi:hypothetical protein